MIAISTLPTVLIVIGGWIAFAFLFALLIGKAIAKGQPPEHPTFDTDHLRPGILEQHEAERQERVDRALRRHGDRRGRAA